MSDPEEVLTGGNVASSVVRVGDTVRKPATAASASVGAFLRFLREREFAACPRYDGIDDQGRQVLEFIPGHVGGAKWPLSLGELERVGGLIRRLHDLSATYQVPVDARWERVMTPDAEEIICHNDLAPWNLVRGAERWAFIDWDGAGPGSRLWDLAYAAITFPPVEAAGDVERIISRVEALVGGYGLSVLQREQLPGMMRLRALAMRDLLVEGWQTGHEPWARLYGEGHAVYWGEVAAFVQRNLCSPADGKDGSQGRKSR